ncbi:S8 family serine peptidase [Mangrovivirga sp. M17]|uniref:Serine protease n=1 Tax=Mangrovivirga halotolerans TaxID=2993936 RepID=A0ABT3RS26_9BACT|nr:S8 family serine peptidase [Mangrovivirga halotolerans]MCX2744148.1 S8 family serine peptidase [Mangrovivirga halotolerans]
MANVSSLQQISIEHAAKDYYQIEDQIERVRRDIALLQKGEKKLTEISGNKDRLKARLNREKKILSETDQPIDILLERVINNPDFQDACILDRLVSFSRTVGRIILGNGGYGTGWLIGNNLMITNQHVFPDADTASHAKLNLAYERDVTGEINSGYYFDIRPDIFFMTPPQPKDSDEEILDFAIVAVEPVGTDNKKLSDFGHVILDQNIGKVFEGENCMIIQHPKGDYKKVVLRDIRLLTVEDAPGADSHLFYQSDTLPGSSGSMVVALGTGEIIALHNAGVPKRDSQGNYIKKNGDIWNSAVDSDDSIDWIANQGVRVSRIVSAIQNLPLPEKMEKVRQDLLNIMITAEDSIVHAVSSKSVVRDSADKQKDKAEPSDKIPSGDKINMSDTPANMQMFVVKLNGGPYSTEFVTQLIKAKYPGAQVEPYSNFNMSTLLKDYMIVSIRNSGNIWDLAAQLEAIEGIEEAEPEVPRFTTMKSGEDELFTPSDNPFLESSGDEPTDMSKYSSKYFSKSDHNSAKGRMKIRKWNHSAVNYDPVKIHKLLKDNNSINNLLDLKIAQFDTGNFPHSKVKNGFNSVIDYDFVDRDSDAMDERAWIKQLTHFGHGMRTGSLIIGNEHSGLPEDKEGNFGLLKGIADLENEDFRIVPFRVTKNVILVGRVGEVVRAADKVITERFDVITMSLGIIPGTRALKEIVKKAYDRGVIWCCAAGNQVKFVVEPAKYPGTICIAATNPEDKPWSGSCSGNNVDIAAPGEDVYVPIFSEKGEDMTYGNGTSYATPHVASSAALWIAKNQDEIRKKYSQGWQRVEAFRYCLHRSARKKPAISSDYGKGILDIDALLNMPLPEANELKYAYDSRFESYSTGSTLAAREDQYKNIANVINGLTKDEVRPGKKVELTESTGSMTSSSRSASLSTFRNVAGFDKGKTILTESMSSGTFIESWERVKKLNDEDNYSKPDYSN